MTQRQTDTLPAEFLLDGFPPAIRETGLGLRRLIFATIPGATETVRPGWRWIAYSLPDGRRVRNFAWIGPEPKHIHLGFEKGVLLADPNRLLHGTEERLRKFRYFTFEPSIELDEAILVDFIRRGSGPRADVGERAAGDRRGRVGTGHRRGDSGRPRGRAHRGPLSGDGASRPARLTNCS